MKDWLPDDGDVYRIRDDLLKLLTVVPGVVGQDVESQDGPDPGFVAVLQVVLVNP